MFEEMHLAPWSKAPLDPLRMPAAAVLKTATLAGPAPGRRGALRGGAGGIQADLVLVDLTVPHLTANFDTVSALVYCAGVGLCLTMADGIILYENGKSNDRHWKGKIRGASRGAEMTDGL